MHGQVMSPLSSTSDKLTMNSHKICLPFKASLVYVSKTFRPERGQKCFLQQISLDGPLFHIIFPHSGTSGQPQAVLPQYHHTASPCWCFPHPNGLPWANTQHQVHSSLFFAWELIPRGQDKRHKPAACWTTAPAIRDEASWSLACQPAFECNQPALAQEGQLH